MVGHLAVHILLESSYILAAWSICWNFKLADKILRGPSSRVVLYVWLSFNPSLFFLFIDQGDRNIGFIVLNL